MNINWIKDIVTIIFAGTATTIGILTYRRARSTILQPIRSEVIKKQSELLSKLLKLMKDNNQSFENGIDYVNVVQINVLCTLRDYGFVFKEHSKILEKMSTEIVGWSPCGKSEQLNDVEVIGTFNVPKTDDKSIDYNKEKYENLKNGQIDIDKIYYTKTLIDFKKELSEFANDPFMPVSIQKSLNQLIHAIQINLVSHLKSVLEKFMLEFSAEANDFPNPDSLWFNFGSYQIIIHGDGSGLLLYNEEKIKSFSLPLPDEYWFMQRIYYNIGNGNILLFYEISDVESDRFQFVKLDDELNIKWMVESIGGNIGEPLVKNKYVYLTALGFVGKLNVLNGKFKWKHENLYYTIEDEEYFEDHFNYFKKPRIKKPFIFFVEELAPFQNYEPLGIIVWDSSGKILEQDKFKK